MRFRTFFPTLETGSAAIKNLHEGCWIGFGSEKKKKKRVR